MVKEKYIPNPLKGLVTLDYALNRYNSSIQWINLHHNAVIGNGPYYLNSFNPTGGIITLGKFNDSTYPYKSGYFSSFVNSSQINIDKINVPKFIKIGSPFQIDLTTNFGNSSKMHNQSNANINYIITDRNNNVVIHDSRNGTEIADFSKNKINQKTNVNTNQISLIVEPNKTKSIPPGPAKLKLFITSMDSLRPLIYEYTLIARP
jgi:peptide/nickel transport system substrate-binding protein